MNETQLELPIHPEPPLSGVRSYFNLLKGTILEPQATFQKIGSSLSASYALFFAISVHWMGSALEFIWKSSLGKLVEHRTSFWMAAVEKIFLETAETDRFPFQGLKEQFLRWIWGVGALVIDPLKTLHQIVVLTIFVWLGAKLLHAIPRDDERMEERLSFSMALTLVCLAQGPSLFQGIPLYGTLVGSVFSFIVLTIGAKVTYRTTFVRGMLIASFPSLIYYGTIAVGLFFLATFLFDFLMNMFWMT